MGDVTREQALEAALRKNAAILQTAARYQTPVREWTCFFIDGDNVTVQSALDEADAALAIPPAQGVEVWPSAKDVADAGEDGAGFWRTCSGCHETNEGYPTGPIHPVLKCVVGGGCRECGGIGAIWDTTDYAEMADYLANPPAPAPWTPPESVNKAVRRVAKIKADLKTFDGDKRGHWAAMDEAMDELYRIIPPLPPAPEARDE